MNKKFKYSIILCILGVLLFTISSTSSLDAFAQSKLSNEPTVKIEVLSNSYDEDFLKNIQFDDGTKVGDYNYEIVYSSSLKSDELSKYFNYVAWITRDDIASLSLEPTQLVRDNYNEKNYSWNVLVNPKSGISTDTRWQNTQVMKWQFDCHYGFAGFKQYWNLEPHRTANSYLQVVLNACNP